MTQAAGRPAPGLPPRDRDDPPEPTAPLADTQGFLGGAEWRPQGGGLGNGSVGSNGQVGAAASSTAVAAGSNSVNQEPWLYKTKMCKFWPHCPRGPKCWFAHGLADLRKPSPIVPMPQGPEPDNGFSHLGAVRRPPPTSHLSLFVRSLTRRVRPPSGTVRLRAPVPRITVVAVSVPPRA